MHNRDEERPIAYRLKSDRQVVQFSQFCIICAQLRKWSLALCVDSAAFPNKCKTTLTDLSHVVAQEGEEREWEMRPKALSMLMNNCQIRGLMR